MIERGKKSGKIPYNGDWWWKDRANIWSNVSLAEYFFSLLSNYLNPIEICVAIVWKALDYHSSNLTEVFMPKLWWLSFSFRSFSISYLREQIVLVYWRYCQANRKQNKKWTWCGCRLYFFSTIACIWLEHNTRMTYGCTRLWFFVPISLG